MAMQDIASIGFTARIVISPNQHFWNHKKSWDIHLVSVKLLGCVYSQYIINFQNPNFLLKKPNDLGIETYRLFPDLLFQLA